VAYRLWPDEPGPPRQLPRAPSPGPLVWPYVLGYLLLSALALPAIPTAIVTALVVRRRGWRLHWPALAAVAVLVVEVVWWRESLVQLHLAAWQIYGLGALQGGPGQTARILALLHARAICEAPVGVPLGVLVAAGVAAEGGRQGAGAPWHPATRREHARSEAREAKRILRRLDDPKAAAKCSAPPLAVARDGDLASWRQGDFAVPPRGLRGRALAVAGRPGMGKTVAAGRLVAADGAAGRRVIFLDAKGTDPGLAWSLVEAWHHGAGVEPSYRLWPASALDGWRGDADELANRLLAGQEWSDAWYKLLASRTVRLACAAPDGPPRSARDFLRRLSPEGLTGAYAGTDELAEVQRVVGERNFAGVELRYANYFDALRGRFDGAWSWDDGEVLFLRMQALAEAEDRSAAFGFLCADLAAWATTRKARLGDDVTIYVDEFSAVSDGAWHAIDLAERLRDVGVGVVFLAQSWEGFGPPELRERLLASCAALVVLGMDRPEPLLAAAGTVQVPSRPGSSIIEGRLGRPASAWSSGPRSTRTRCAGPRWGSAGSSRAAGTCTVRWSGPRPCRGRPNHSGPPRRPWRFPGCLRDSGTGVRALERPLAAFGATAPAEQPALAPPRRALVARQLAARVAANELELAGELATAFGLEAELQAMVEASEERRPVSLAGLFGFLLRWWRP